MKNLNFLVLIVLLLLSSVSFANGGPKKKFKAKNISKFYRYKGGFIYSGEGEIGNKDGEINCNSFFKVDSVVFKANSLLRPYFKIPQDIVVNVESVSGNAYALGALFNIPMTLSIDDLLINPRYTTLVWVHEYGHLIFTQNLGDHFLPYAPITKLREKYAKVSVHNGKLLMDLMPWEKKLDALDDVLYELEESVESIEDLLKNGDITNVDRERLENTLVELEKNVVRKEKEYNTLEAEYEKAYSEVEGKIINTDDLEQQFEKHAELMDLVGGYHELFADILAETFDSADDVIYKGLKRTKFFQNTEDTPELMKSILDRSFYNRKNRIDKWEPTLESHGYFAPVRYHLGTNYIKRPMYHDHPGEFLNKLIKVFAEDIEEKYKLMQENPEFLFEHFYSEEGSLKFNQGFIDRIDKAFK